MTSGDELTRRVGEYRRLTVMFCDLVGSTELSGRLDPETYRNIVRRYHAACREVIEERFDGRIVQIKGDGMLSTFGYPTAHEDDAERAVRAGLAVVRAVHELSYEEGDTLAVRVGVHHGLMYLDFETVDVYGFAANEASRLQGLAEPGTVVISDAVARLVERHFDVAAGDPRRVKGVAEPLTPVRVVRERPVPSPPPALAPLVERGSELDRLRALWQGARSDGTERPSAVLVHGEAGLGKSRLVTTFAEEAAVPVVWLHGSPFHTDAGFWPVRALMSTRCGVGDDAAEPERLERLRRELDGLGLNSPEIVSRLAPVMGLHPRAGYEQAPAVGRMLEEQVAEAVLDYVIACTGPGPAILIAENMHWFDDFTREMLASRLRARRGRLLVIATSRGSERGRWEEIELRQLSLEGRLELIEALAGDLPDDHRRVLAERSGGVPLYVEALARTGPSGHAHASASPAPAPGSVPEVLYEPLVARLYATPHALPVAAAAAAAGLEADPSLLAAVLAIPGPELEASLATLADARILEAVDGARRYRFRHELLREVAYELQPPSWRRKVHAKLSEVLALEEPVDWHVLALHCERAERPLEAAAALEQAADWARRRGALDEARAYLDRAVDLVKPLTAESTHDHREVELRLRRGFLATSVEGVGSPQASADFARCLQLAAGDPQGDDRFRTLICLWAYYLSRADLDRAREVSVTLRDALEGGRDMFRPQNLAGFGILDWFAGSFSASLRALITATAELDRIPGEDAVSEAWFIPNHPTAAMYVHLGLAWFTAGDPDAASAALERARAVASALAFPQGPWSACYADWLGAWMWMEAGRLEQAASDIERLRASSARHGFDGWELIAALHEAALDGATALTAAAPDPAELTAHADAIGGLIDVWEGLELRVFLPFYITLAGALLAAAGQPGDALQRYEQSRTLARETGMRFYDAETMRLHAALAEGEEAAACLRAALDLARAQGARLFEARIDRDLRALAGPRTTAAPQ